MDSGANISCFGSEAERVVGKLGLKIKRLCSAVKTADGAEQAIIGYVDVQVKYADQTKRIRFYLIPLLNQTLYLGIDFWKEFGLSVVPMKIAELENQPPTDSKTHHLSPEQTRRLQQVLKTFPSSETDGLGKTSLIQHSIITPNCEPVKQRYYAVSPAVQNLIDVELNRMIALGVVEESQSPLSSPVVLIRKDTG